MVDQLKQIIEQVSSQTAKQEKGITPELVGQVTQETGNSIISGVKDSLAQGNLSQLSDLFGGAGSITSNPAVLGMIANLVSSLTGKLGIDNGIAQNFASSTIPKILESLISKSNDSNSGFQLTDLIGSLSNGSDASSLMSGLGGSLGLDKNKDGKLGLDDAASLLKGLF